MFSDKCLKKWYLLGVTGAARSRPRETVRARGCRFKRRYRLQSHNHTEYQLTPTSWRTEYSTPEDKKPTGAAIAQRIRELPASAPEISPMIQKVILRLKKPAAGFT